MQLSEASQSVKFHALASRRLRPLRRMVDRYKLLAERSDKDVLAFIQGESHTINEVHSPAAKAAGQKLSNIPMKKGFLKRLLEAVSLKPRSRFMEFLDTDIHSESKLIGSLSFLSSIILSPVMNSSLLSAVAIVTAVTCAVGLRSYIKLREMYPLYYLVHSAKIISQKTGVSEREVYEHLLSEVESMLQPK